MDFACITPIEAERAGKWHHDGKVLQYLNDRDPPEVGPWAHLALQPETADNPTHFHETDQFQIFIGGSGVVGSHPVHAGTIHYADAYRSYGPIEAGPEGLRYLTLRPEHDISFHQVPQEAALARGRRGGQKVVQVDLSDNAERGSMKLFERSDGAAAYQQVLGPGKPLIDIGNRSASFAVVLKGGLVQNEKECPAGSCIWREAGISLPETAAGPSGAVIAVMYFPDLESRLTRQLKSG